MSQSRFSLDVGGVAVEIRSADPVYTSCVTSRLGQCRATEPPVVGVTIGPEPPKAPPRPPDQSMEGYDSWERGTTLWIRGEHPSAVQVDDHELRLGGPATSAAEMHELGILLQFGIATALAAPTRLMIHAAVVSRGSHALAIVGTSGAGKSTLAAAALLDGWTLLGDDLAVVDPVLRQVRSVQRPPMVPADIAAAHGLEGELEPGPRPRVRMPVSTLSPEPHHLAGLIAVEHGDRGGWFSDPGADLEALDEALAVPPFPKVMRRHLAAGAALIALPTVALFHRADPETRVERAQQLLLQAFDHCRRHQ